MQVKEDVKPRDGLLKSGSLLAHNSETAHGSHTAREIDIVGRSILRRPLLKNLFWELHPQSPLLSFPTS